MQRKNKSILRKLYTYMMAFGIAMGFIFPVYANIFVEWKEGYFIYFLIGCIMAGITVGLVSFWFVKIILIKQLIKASDVAQALAQKDISVHLDINSHDAIGNISDGFNSVIKSLNELMHEIKNITQAAKSFTNSKIKQDGSEGSISKLNTNLIELSETTSSITNLSESINSKITQSYNSVASSSLKMKETQHMINEFSGTMTNILNNTQKIDNIVNVIQDFAGQTNILAMNASIEASKAGEFGRSFAVVASEVRKLSIDTANSVSEITDTVLALNDDMQKANQLNTSIVELFNENLIQNELIKELSQTINGFSHSNVEENKNLDQIMNKVTDSAQAINQTFESFLESINDLHLAMGQYKI